MTKRATCDQPADFIEDVPAVPGSRDKCEHCGSRGADFLYEGHHLCCECMSTFCSWLLDGGMRTDPEQFDYLIRGGNR
jgi:hypothetical protein